MKAKPKKSKKSPTSKLKGMDKTVKRPTPPPRKSRVYET